MKVLYVSKALVVAAYRDKIRELAAHVDVRALVPDRWGRVPVEGRDVGAKRVRFQRAWLHGHSHFHFYPLAGRILDEERPDLVHIDEEPYSAVTLQWVRLCRRRSLPCLFFAWQNLQKRLPPPFGMLRRRVFRQATAGIAGTPGAAEVLRRAGFDGPLAVIPQFGVDPDRFAPDPLARRRIRNRLGVPDRQVLIGYSGRLIPEKGVDVLLKAVAALPGARALIVGDGPERPALEDRARAAGVSGRIHFQGHVPSVEMPAWLSAMDVLALPSLSASGWVEQFGRALTEAMACRVPVVASDSGEIPSVVGEAGLIVLEGDVEALAGALRQLAAAPEMRAELGRKGRARVLESYTQKRVAEDTVAFYRTIAADAPARGSTVPRRQPGGDRDARSAPSPEEVAP